MSIQQNTFKTVLVILGISFLSACGSRQSGAHGGAFIAPDIRKDPIVNEPEIPAEPETTEVIVFATAQTFAGDLTKAANLLTARESADALCEQRRTAALQDLQIRALISINTDDEILDMPLNYGLPVDLKFVGETGTIIANDFADLLDGSIALSMKDAVSGVMTGEEFWTGSLADGSIDADTCDSWTSEVGNGAVGSADATDETFMKTASRDCSARHKLICLAF